MYFPELAETQPPGHPVLGPEPTSGVPTVQNSLCRPQARRGVPLSPRPSSLTRVATSAAPAPGSPRSARSRLRRRDAGGGAGEAAREARRGGGDRGKVRRGQEQGPNPGGAQGPRRAERLGADWRCPWCCRPRARAPAGRAGRHRLLSAPQGWLTPGRQPRKPDRYSAPLGTGQSPRRRAADERNVERRGE